MQPDNATAAGLMDLVSAGQLGGAVTQVWRGDKLVDAGTVGWRDIDAKVPMTQDTIFRIASLSKPITSMAALMLMERGHFTLDDPITRWAPEFTNARVLRTPDGSLDETDPAARPITFEDLLTHRSGLTYGEAQDGPIRAAHKTLGRDIDSDLTPSEWIERLATLPLIDQPGNGFHYGHSTDILGLLLGRIADEPLEDVLTRLIFEPLGMRDTGFSVPVEHRHRRAAQYGFDGEGRLTILETTPGGATMAERPAGMTYQSGGQGLWSTVPDYSAFARTLVGHGPELVRPETLRLMRKNRLTDGQRRSAALLGMPLFGDGNGFGLGVAVVLDPAKASVMHGSGGVGTVGWPGAYGGWWQADPTNASVMVLLTHNMLELEQLLQGVGFGVYAATAQFHEAATKLLNG